MKPAWSCEPVNAGVYRLFRNGAPCGYLDEHAAKRLVACANACEGIVDVTAVPDMQGALKAILNSDMAMREEDEGRESPLLNNADAAIAKAEGRV